MIRARMCEARSWLLSGLLLLLAPWHAAQAATVSIESLLIDSAALTIAITGDGTASYSGPVTPPVQIVMGRYQDPIVQISNGFLSAKIYSTGAFGLPAPTGSVDTVTGTMDVNFSSLRANAMTALGSLDIAVPLITSPPTIGVFDSGTNAYTLNWSDSFSAIVAGRTISGIATVTLGGTATLVPVPAALWLLGSGLFGLAAVSRRRRRVA